MCSITVSPGRMNDLSHFHIFWVFHPNWRGSFPLCLAFISTLLSHLSFCFFPVHFPLPQAKVDNEILNYKDLAALPKVKSIYEVQRPDLISYEPHSRYTSDEMLERCGYGEVRGLALSLGLLEERRARGVPRSLNHRDWGLHSGDPQTLLNWFL